MIYCMKLGYQGVGNNLLVNPGKAIFLVRELRLKFIPYYRSYLLTAKAFSQPQIISGFRQHGLYFIFNMLKLWKLM